MIRRVRWRRGGQALVIGALVVACACAPHLSSRSGQVPPTMTLRVRVASGIVSVPLEDYVRGVILSEFAPGSGKADAIEQMLEVQAIASRTYALTSRHIGEGFDFCSTTHCQLYDPSRAMTSRWTAAAVEAVRQTTGVVVRYGNAPAKIVFHADCGGHTSAARDVWSGDDPAYLAAVDDDGPAAAAHGVWSFAASTVELQAALNGDVRTRVGDRLDRIDVLRRDGAGRAQLVAIDGERAPVVRGEELRAVLSRAFGARALRSTRFDVVRTDRGFEFTGRGFGHGVGLCQAGALARVAAGSRPADVLAHYFPGTSIR